MLVANLYTDAGRPTRILVDTLGPITQAGVRFVPTGTSHRVGAQPTLWSYVPA